VSGYCILVGFLENEVGGRKELLVVMLSAELKVDVGILGPQRHVQPRHRKTDLAAVDMVSEEVGSTGPPRQYKVPESSELLEHVHNLRHVGLTILSRDGQRQSLQVWEDAELLDLLRREPPVGGDQLRLELKLLQTWQVDC